MLVQFLHDQLLTLAGVTPKTLSPTRIGALRDALRYATFLTDDPLLIPTVDLVQSPLSRFLVSDFEVLAREQYVEFIGSSVDIEEIHTSKQAHFKKTSLSALWQDRESYDRLVAFQPSLRARQSNTTADLKQRWMTDMGGLARGDKPSPLTRQIQNAAVLLDRTPDDKRFRNAMALVPRRLEEHAFLWGVVEELRIVPFRTAGAPKLALETGLAWHWLMSHLLEYGTQMLGTLPGIGDMSFGVAQTAPERIVRLWTVREAMKVLGLNRPFACLGMSEVVALREDATIVHLRDTVLRRLYSELLWPSPTSSPSTLPIASTIRDAVKDAHGPADAMRRAGEAALRTVKSTPSRGTSEAPVVVGVVIALVEELAYLRETIESVVGPLQADESAHSGRVVYRVPTIINRRGVHIDLFFAIVGKGQERAAAATATAIQEHSPQVVVNIGIAGAMSSDVALGDVVVASEVTAYLANSKAIPKGEHDFEFTLAGQSVATDLYLSDKAAQLELLDDALMKEIKDRLQVKASADILDAATRGDMRFRLLTGPIASGPTVAAAPTFKRWLAAHKRDYLAVEMEAAGTGTAVEIGGMMRRVRYVVLRGISDLGDDQKTALEEETQGAVRRIATVAPLEMLLGLLDVLPREAFTSD